MSLLFAAALAVSTATMPACSWDRPGANPYVGEVLAAVDRYADIPAAVRARLKQRMGDRQYDDVAVIRRDAIVGKQHYSPEIRDMHFGQGRVCRTVTRTKWAPGTEERGLVYCESGHCIIVPTVCRNVSRITRLPPERTAAAAAENPPSGGGDAPPAALAPRAAAADTGRGELDFEPPAAGPSFAQQADPGEPAQRVSTSPAPGAVGGGTTIVDGGGGSGGGGHPGGEAPPLPLDPWRPGGGTGAGWLPADALPPALAVPEPASGALWLLGLAVLSGAARRRRFFSS